LALLVRKREMSTISWIIASSMADVPLFIDVLTVFGDQRLSDLNHRSVIDAFSPT